MGGEGFISGWQRGCRAKCKSPFSYKTPPNARDWLAMHHENPHALAHTTDICGDLCCGAIVQVEETKKEKKKTDKTRMVQPVTGSFRNAGGET